jgi:predicted XRE-type DNA-binding protein
MAQLATVFGVSRQRVSALLRDSEDLPQAAEHRSPPATRASA